MLDLLDAVSALLIRLAPAMPPQAWGVTAGVVGILVLTAAVDAFTAVIPDIAIFFGLLAITAAQGFWGSWDAAADSLRQAVAAGALIWAVNVAWYKIFRHDALGMGDAKWTMLVVACFGVMPAVFAWGLGAVLACLYLGAARLARRPVSRVTFAPFLLTGLGAGIYWLRAV